MLIPKHLAEIKNLKTRYGVNFLRKKGDIFFQISISQSMLHHFMVKTEGEQKQQRNRLFAQKAYNNVFYYSEFRPF